MTDKGNDLSSMSMMDLFRQEAESHCAALSDNLLSLERKPADPEVLASLMRAAHSIKGAARIVDLPVVVELAHAMEDVFVAAQDGKLVLAQEDIDLLLQGMDMLDGIGRVAEDKMTAWLAGQSTAINTLVADFKTLAAGGEKKSAAGKEAPPDIQTVPPPSPAPEKKAARQSPADLSSMSMMDLFRQEAESHCAALSDNLLSLERKPTDPEALTSLMRAAHSIKGAARIVDLPVVVELAHAMEDVFVAAQKGDILLGRDHIDILLKGVDLLTDLARQDESEAIAWLKGREKAIASLVTACKDVSAGREITAAAPPPPQPREQVKTKPEMPPQEEAKAVDRALRVSAEGMNRLMGFAGEVQVESRWLPAFAHKALKLKRRQDDVYRLLNSYLDKVRETDPAADEELSKNGFHNLLARMDICRSLVNEYLAEIEDHARRATEISHHLYHEVIANRMRPFADGIRGFPRMVRDLARELGKEVEFEIIGSDTLVDRDILDKIEAPLNHLLRNAIDHGVESPSERLQAGKPEKALIRLEARHSAGMLNIVVSDDGYGIDIEKLRRKIVDKKMIAEEMARDLRETELLDFLFLPNFSTRDTVSKVSGRGVGLDVVHSAVHEVRGLVRISTKPGAGTTFEMQLPLTLSVMRSLLVAICGEIYAFPLVAIDHVIRVQGEIKEVEGRQYVTFNREQVGLVSARQVLEKRPAEAPENEGDELPIVIVSDRYNRYGLIVDRFLEIRDLVVQPLDRRLKKVQNISAVAILEDGTPVLIVDVEDMVHSVDYLIYGNRLHRIGGEDIMDERRLKRILVVDDSITVREVERKMLAVKGYEVKTAVDGKDGLNALRNEDFDLVVTDVDMPRMNGIELVSLIRSDARFERLPVIIVSYKDREEDRQRGLEAGADYYLTKGSFQDETLLRTVEELIGGPDQD
ncbi:Signal transduction histidine kinase CheA [hydrothermal vent metagenome]|uniref:histidine kinase n=1 Tax=hydrothermal vent metagenome TaxID=652676 RepID=A0A3B0VQG2_9ZZZZ